MTTLTIPIPVPSPVLSQRVSRTAHREGMESTVAVAPLSPTPMLERDRVEGTNAMRGLLFGVLFSLPVWAGIIWGVSALWNALVH